MPVEDTELPVGADQNDPMRSRDEIGASMSGQERLREHAGMLFRFGIVGGTTAAIYVGGLALSVEAAGQSPTVGAVIASAVAVTFNYLAHQRWTYGTDRRVRSSAPRYLMLVVCILCVNVWQLPFSQICLALATRPSNAAWLYRSS